MSFAKNFKEVNLTDLQLNPWQAIGNEWMLVTAGEAAESGRANTMTASWGGMGVLWQENVAFVFIRPQRYTKEFIDAQPRFSLSFFDGYKKEMGLLGSVSGRDRDKIAESGLHLTILDGVPAFAEARLVLVVQKLYADEFRPEKFILPEYNEKIYQAKDYHTMYVVKIEKAYLAEN